MTIIFKIKNNYSNKQSSYLIIYQIIIWLSASFLIYCLTLIACCRFDRFRILLESWGYLKLLGVEWALLFSFIMYSWILFSYYISLIFACINLVVMILLLFVFLNAPNFFIQYYFHLLNNIFIFTVILS